MKRLILLLVLLYAFCDPGNDHDSKMPIEEMFCGMVLKGFPKSGLASDFTNKTWGFNSTWSLKINADLRIQAIAVDDPEVFTDIGRLELGEAGGLINLQEDYGVGGAFTTVRCEIFQEVVPPQQMFRFYDKDGNVVLRLSRREPAAKYTECLRYVFGTDGIVRCKEEP